MFQRFKTTFWFLLSVIIAFWVIVMVMMGLALTVANLGESKYFYAIGIFVLTFVHTTIFGSYAQYLMETFDD